MSVYPVFFKHSFFFFRSGQVSMRDSYYVKLSVRQNGELSSSENTVLLKVRYKL